MPSITVEGKTVSYRDEGAGPPLLLLHCTGGSSAQWAGMSERLRHLFRLRAVDLHGYGGTDPWPGHAPLTLADEAFLALGAAMDIAEPLHVVGHSFGGAVALKIAEIWPSRVASLTLIEPTAFYLVRDLEPLGKRMYGEVMTGFAGPVWDALISGHFERGMETFMDYWNGPGSWKSFDADTRAKLTRKLGAIALNCHAGSIEDTPLAAYRHVHAPTQLLAGTISPAPVRHVAEVLAETLPNATIMRVAGAGHMLPLTHPDIVTDAVRRFVEERAVSFPLTANAA